MTQIKSVNSRFYRLARAIAGTDDKLPSSRGGRKRIDLTREQKQKARTLARKGYTLADIKLYIDFPGTESCLYYKLRTLNIKPGPLNRRAENSK